MKNFLATGPLRAWLTRHAAVCGLVALGLLTACGGGGGGAAAPTVPPVPPSITAQPQSVSVPDGASASFSVAATGDGPLSYQWTKNGVAVPGATGQSLSTPALSMADNAAKYAVVVSNSVASVTSAAATLTVIPFTPGLDVQPKAATVVAGSSYTFVASAHGSAPLTYQWMRAGLPVTGATSSSYTVTAAFYDDAVNYSVVVSNAAGVIESQRVAMTVNAATPPQQINSCTKITAPGSYVLSHDIVVPTGSKDFVCVDVLSNDVLIDCAGFAIRTLSNGLTNSMDLTSLSNFSVRHCHMDSIDFSLESVNWGSINNNIIENTAKYNFGLVVISSSDHVTLHNNTIAGMVALIRNTNITVSNNTVTMPYDTPYAVLESSYGVSTQIMNNVLDGRWDGDERTGQNGTRTGAEEAILMTDEEGFKIEGNVIKNTWECGIKSVGLFAHGSVTNNNISTTGCAIGGRDWSSVLDVRFANNTASNALVMFQYYHQLGLRLWESTVYFKDNVFEANTFTNPLSFTKQQSAAATIPVYDNLWAIGAVIRDNEKPVLASSLSISNNVFKNNKFPAQVPAPNFGSSAPVAGYIVDGGGNACQKPDPSLVNYPLVCNAP